MNKIRCHHPQRFADFYHIPDVSKRDNLLNSTPWYFDMLRGYIWARQIE
jgi:hypothetical protein